MLVNWKLIHCEHILNDEQASDYHVKGQPYWFFRYFENKPDLDVIGMQSFPMLEKIEKNVIRFYIWQTLKVIPRLKDYDLIISHGMQSGVLMSLLRRLFKIRARHIVFDIGSFNSAAEKGFALKLMQFASKSIDGVIYHTSKQIDYYMEFYPWLVSKSKFIRFGTDLDFFNYKCSDFVRSEEKYIICVGYSKRDWDTLVKAYSMLKTDVKLYLVGHIDSKYNNIKGIKQISFVPIKKLMEYINDAVFCVLPLESFNYSYGQMTLMQQMALKKCVITAEVPSLVDYVKNDTTAILYKPKDAKNLAMKMGELLENPIRAKQIGENAKKYLDNFCNEKIMAKDIEKCLKEWKFWN